MLRTAVVCCNKNEKSSNIPSGSGRIVVFQSFQISMPSINVFINPLLIVSSITIIFEYIRQGAFINQNSGIEIEMKTTNCCQFEIYLNSKKLNV